MTREEKNEDIHEEAAKEENKRNRIKTILKIIKYIFIFLIMFYGFYLYVEYISTSQIIVKEERIIDEHIPSSFNGLKIIHFSDLHYGSSIDSKKLDEIIKLINDRNPDIVIFTGDLISKDITLDNKKQEKLTKKLQQIHAKLGKYSVIGDEDTDNYSTIMNQSDFIVLNNEYDILYNEENENILLMGFSSSIQKNLDIDKPLNYFNITTANNNIFSIAIFHEPDTTEKILDKQSINLLLAGHSHNGNIRIPFLGAVKKTEGAKKYINPFYKINNSKLYISSGLGTEDDGIRLFTRPSINFFRLSNS